MWSHDFHATGGKVAGIIISYGNEIPLDWIEALWNGKNHEKPMKKPYKMETQTHVIKTLVSENDENMSKSGGLDDWMILLFCGTIYGEFQQIFFLK